MNAIRSAVASDAGRLCAIYNHYVLNDVATFEEEPVLPADMRQRVEEVRPGATAQKKAFSYS